MSYQPVVEPEAVAVLQRATKLFCQLVGVNVGVELTHCHILGLKYMQQPLMTVPFSCIALSPPHKTRLSRGYFQPGLAL